VDIVVVGPGELDDRGTAIVAGWLGSRPAGTLLAALGWSALGIYRGLAGLRAAGRLDTAALTLVQLDEYAGIPAADPRSLRAWLERDVAVPLGVPAERIVALPGEAAADAAAAGRACAAYDAAVRAAGGIDVAVLGLGPNGHLGFNEPPSGPAAPTRLVDLSPASLESSRRYFGADAVIPGRALTAGMDALLRARRTLLVVAGSGKAAILRRLLDEPVADDLPASHLRSIAGVTLLADREAWPHDRPIPAMIPR